MFDFLKTKTAKTGDDAVKTAETNLATAAQLYAAKQQEVRDAAAEVQRTLAAFQANPDAQTRAGTPWSIHEAAKQEHAKATAIVAAAQDAEGQATVALEAARKRQAAEAIAALPSSFEAVVGIELVKEGIRLGDDLAAFALRVRDRLAEQAAQRAHAIALAEQVGLASPGPVDGDPQTLGMLGTGPQGIQAARFSGIAASFFGWWVASRLERGLDVPSEILMVGGPTSNKLHNGRQAHVESKQAMGPFGLSARITERPLRAARFALGLPEPKARRPFDPKREFIGPKPGGWTEPGEREPLVETTRGPLDPEPMIIDTPGTRAFGGRMVSGQP